MVRSVRISGRAWLTCAPHTDAIERLLVLLEDRKDPKSQQKKESDPNWSRKIIRPMSVAQRTDPTVKSKEFVDDDDSEEDVNQLAVTLSPDQAPASIVPETQPASTEVSVRGSPPKKRQHEHETIEERAARKAAKKARRSSQQREKGSAGTDPAAAAPVADTAGQASEARHRADEKSARKAAKKARKLSLAAEASNSRPHAANEDFDEATSARKAAKAAKKAARA